VFGVPKSLSIYLAITGDRVVENIARSAVDETMRAMEAEMQCKVRKGGLHEDRRTGERRIAQHERDRKRTKRFQGKAEIENWRQQMGPERWDSITPERAKEGPQLELPINPCEVAIEAYFAKHSVARDRWSDSIRARREGSSLVRSGP